MALSGGKGFGPKGARGDTSTSKDVGRDGGIRDVAGANNRAGGYAAGGSVGGGLSGGNDKGLGERIGDIFGGPAAYRNAQMRRNPAAYTANFPYASGLMTAGAVFDALTSATPLGVGGLLARAGQSAITGEPMSTGWGMDAALAMGGELGPQVGTKGVGFDRMHGRDVPGIGLAPTEQTASQPTPPTTQPTLSNPYGTAQWSGGYLGIGGPSPYGINLASYPYAIRK